MKLESGGARGRGRGRQIKSIVLARACIVISVREKGARARHSLAWLVSRYWDSEPKGQTAAPVQTSRLIESSS